MRKKTIHIVLASDDRFRIGLLATVRSITQHLSESYQLDVNILDCGLSNPTEVAEILRRNAAVRIVVRVRPVARERLEKFGLNRPRLSKAAFARLLAPSLLPDLNRVLYLDSDLLVTRNIAELWDLDLGGRPIGAVPDPYFVFLGSDVSNCRELGVSPYHRYFGSGVLLVDLRQWREEGVENTLMALGEPGRLVRKFNDQSILNFFFAGRVRFLPKRWNQLRFHWNNSAAFSPWRRGIVHVGGSPKPWHFPAEGAVGVNRLYRAIMRGADVPPSWLPGESARNPRQDLQACVQTFKLMLRSGPAGYLHSAPHVFRWVLDGAKGTPARVVAKSTSG